MVKTASPLLDITRKINQTEIMRVSARIVFIALFSLVLSFTLKTPAYAQADQQPSTTTVSNYLLPNADSDVPVNHHSYTQIMLIDGLSSLMCLMAGVDPSNPNQPCLGVDPTTGKIGLATQPSEFGQAQGTQIGGAVGLITQSIGTLYTPAVSSSQYFGYLADNFGIVKKTYAANTIAPGGGATCNTSFGYGFCGLSPIFTLWSEVRDIAYAMLTLLFILIGVGVMLRFRVDPRTVMTLQNQIPRVVIAILLITFSYAIAGIMIDLMWTVTYTGINYISDASPNSRVQIDCNKLSTPLSQTIEQRLLDQPISFTNTVLTGSCAGVNGGLIQNGLLSLSTQVAGSAGDLVSQLLHDLLFAGGSGCHFSWWDLIPLVSTITLAKCALGSVALNIFLWLTELLVKIIIIIAILVALFRLWFKLIQAYLTFLIFVILGPIWIVLGLIPGRPMGFEKWIRIVFANLAVFPLVAFLLVFARVIVDTTTASGVLGAATSAAQNGSVLAAATAQPQDFVPPLIGNPSMSTFADLMAFGAILLSPTIPDLIKERMKATGQAKYGAAIAAGIGVGAAAFSAPGKKIWEGLNRKNPTTGEPEGSLAVMRQRTWQRLPIVGRRSVDKKAALRKVHNTYGGDMSRWSEALQEAKAERLERNAQRGGRAQRRATRQTGRQRIRDLQDQGRQTKRTDRGESGFGGWRNKQGRRFDKVRARGRGLTDRWHTRGSESASGGQAEPVTENGNAPIPPQTPPTKKRGRIIRGLKRLRRAGGNTQAPPATTQVESHETIIAPEEKATQAVPLHKKIIRSWVKRRNKKAKTNES